MKKDKLILNIILILVESSEGITSRYVLVILKFYYILVLISGRNSCNPIKMIITSVVKNSLLFQICEADEASICYFNTEI